MHAHLNGRYLDPVWPLAALTENPNRALEQIHWRRCPAAFQPEIRRTAWTLINGELRPSFLFGRGTRFRARTSLSKVKETVQQWTHLADPGLSRDRIADILISLTRLWAYDQLSVRPSGVARPPWDEHAVDDYLPVTPASSGGENETEPLAEQTMGPLLVWALRMVEDFAEDILAGHSETQRLAQAARTNPTTAHGLAALHAYFEPFVTGNTPVPATVNQGRSGSARAYVGGITGASRHQVALYAERTGLVAAASRRPGPCPVSIPVHGRIGERPWRAVIDFNETGRLLRHLVTACFVVIAYLTGMRPGEVLGLRTGCCPPSGDAESPRWHRIHSRAYKSAVDDHGSHLSAGVERDVPWVAHRSRGECHPRPGTPGTRR
ncbi:hypothetical protein AB0N81_22705 [Streptomyces sp. NPDC093510]|uniref:hypothetical protein n=1 Tax=Streptomyces sp. NPDC093510 TaxID=3155199 RepID=UPI003438E245